MERIRLDDIRSISYLKFDGEFQFTVGQRMSRGEIIKIEEDLWHLSKHNKIRYLIWLDNGEEEKVWKTVPHDARCLQIEQFT